MIDKWLTGTTSDSLEEVQLLLINDILLVLSNITVLGGQKGKGAPVVYFNPYWPDFKIQQIKRAADEKIHFNPTLV